MEGQGSCGVRRWGGGGGEGGKAHSILDQVPLPWPPPFSLPPRPTPVATASPPPLGVIISSVRCGCFA